VIPIETPYQLVSKHHQPEKTIVKVGDVHIGGADLVVIAGPCAVEGEEQLKKTALAIKKAGASILRGGAFKPRTSPYSFQGLKTEGLAVLARVKEEVGLPAVSEVMDPREVDDAAIYLDLIQIGARNMSNTPLLQEVGRQKRPVLLKRNPAATYEEWLLAAEYIAAEGNTQIILCERGLRTFEPYTRNTLDVGAVPALKEMTHLPVLVDPSHGTGRWHMVPDLSKAALAAGADGLMIEVHCDPERALSDGRQSLHPDRFSRLMEQLRKLKQTLEQIK